MATKEKITAVVSMLCEAFNRKPSAATFKVYMIGLADVSDELLDAAATVVVSSNAEFMPTPGKLRELALCGGITYEQRAELAWREFDRAVAHEGPDRSVSFADGLINATVRLCGDWVFCCGRTGDNYGVWLKKQFIETYSRLCMNGADESLRQPLMGNMERENLARYGAEQMAEYQAKFPRCNSGQTITIGTSQPVLLPPGNPTIGKVIERSAKVPRLELKKANA